MKVDEEAKRKQALHGYDKDDSCSRESIVPNSCDLEDTVIQFNSSPWSKDRSIDISFASTTDDVEQTTLQSLDFDFDDFLEEKLSVRVSASTVPLMAEACGAAIADDSTATDNLAQQLEADLLLSYL